MQNIDNIQPLNIFAITENIPSIYMRNKLPIIQFDEIENNFFKSDKEFNKKNRITQNIIDNPDLDPELYNIWYNHHLDNSFIFYTLKYDLPNIRDIIYDYTGLDFDEWYQYYLEWKTTYDQLLNEEQERYTYIIEKFVERFPQFINLINSVNQKNLKSWSSELIESSSLEEFMNRYGKENTDTDIYYIYYHLGQTPEDKLERFNEIQKYVESIKESGDDIDIRVDDEFIFDDNYKRNWYPKFKKEYTLQVEELQRILNHYIDLLGYSPIIPRKNEQGEVFNIKGAKYQYKKVLLRINNKPVQYSDFEQLFNDVILSYNIPYFATNVNDKIYTKIYEGKPLELDLKDVDFDFLKPKLGQFIFLLWTGTDTNKKSYIKWIYNSETGFLTMSDIIDVDQIDRFEYIQEALPTLIIDDLVQNTIRGNIYFDIPINREVFIDLITNDPIVSEYFYVNESINPNTFKTNLEIYYKYQDIDARISPDGSMLVTSDINDVNSFIELLGSIINYYTQHAQEIQNIYNRAFSTGEVIEKQVVAAVKKSRLAILKSNFPDIFKAIDEKKSYSSSCQGSRQPTVINQIRKNQWISQPPFNSGGKEYTPDFLPFPTYASTDRFLICEDPATPFVGIIKHESGLPVPCCFKEPQYDTNAYVAYKTGQPIQVGEVIKKENRIRSVKIIQEGRIGDIIIEFYNFISPMAPDNKKWNRYGVIKSPNSIIASILQALNNEEYKKTRNKETFLQKERLKIVKSFQDSRKLCVIQQQTFDISQNDILEYLRSDKYLNPYYFYHMLEEYYNITLFIFETIDNQFRFQIPRYTIYPYRTPNRQRPYLFLYVLEQQVEYFSYNDVSIFTDTELYNYVWDQYKRSLQLIQWNGKKIITDDFYNSTLFQTILPLSVSQNINVYGKLKSLNVIYNDVLSTIFIPMGEPLNLPCNDTVYIGDNQLIKYLGLEPTNVSINGIWYGDIYMIQTDDVITRYKKSLRYKPPPIATGLNVISDYRTQSRNVKIFQQLVLWLYQYTYDGKTLMEPEMFMKQYMCYQEDTTNNDYNFDLLQTNYLPDSKTITEALRFVHDNVDTLVNDRLFIILRDKVLYQQIVYMLQKYRREYNPETKITSLVLFFAPQDFKKQEYVKMFFDEIQWLQWKNSLTKPTFVHDKLTYDDKINKYPIILQYDDNYFIIQNVENGSYNSAINIGYKWNQFSQNTGFYTSDELDIEKDVDIGVIDRQYNGIIDLSLIDKTTRNKNMVYLVNYEPSESEDVERGYFAAILPLY